MLLIFYAIFWATSNGCKWWAVSFVLWLLCVLYILFMMLSHLVNWVFSFVTILILHTSVIQPIKTTIYPEDKNPVLINKKRDFSIYFKLISLWVGMGVLFVIFFLQNNRQKCNLQPLTLPKNHFSFWSLKLVILLCTLSLKLVIEKLFSPLVLKGLQWFMGKVSGCKLHFCQNNTTV